MKRRGFLAATTTALMSVLTGTAIPACAEEAAGRNNEDTPVRVVLETELGPIVLILALDRAPITGANFLQYVDLGRLNGIRFYRAMKRSETAGLVQGGVGDRALAPIPHEPTSLTGLSHTDGAISLARWAPGTGTCDFFIVVGDMTFLDAGKATSGDTLGFAVFGHVVEGMDIVRKILDAPVSPTVGEGVMRGQMLEPPIPILKAERTA